MSIDQTHNPQLRSWVAEANGHPDFPIQNLPFAIFTPPGDPRPRGGVAIGDHILDLFHLHQSCLLSPVAHKVCASAATVALDHFLTLGPGLRTLLRQELSALLAEGAPPRPELLHRAADCTLELPTRLQNYTDFYAGIHHARNVGSLFRPENPLLPNYKWVPIGYHGRASSVRPSGIPVRRPQGQTRLPGEPPTFGPTQALDFELELGLWIGPGNDLGQPIPIEQAHHHIAGYCLLNDWSARDLQSWEYQPLGPFLAKSFHTTISPWIITPEALAPFRTPQQPRPAGDPEPLPYLYSVEDQQTGALSLDLEISLSTETMRALNLPPERLTRTHAEHLYWTPAQLVTHHTSNGCNLQPGDLLGTGTISSPPPGNAGSLLELTHAGTQPLHLASGEQRLYLEDGDEILLRATAQREGFAPIGFGECRAILTASGSKLTAQS